MPKGGGIKLVDGLATIVREAGGELRTDAEVERILVADGRATAVRLVGGETIPAARAVLACVTPTQLYGRLLGEGDVPARVGEAARRFRYRTGRDADPRRHERAAALARRRPARPRAPAPSHAGPRRRLARRQAERGLLPAEATIALGQPVALDSSRAPVGSWILWVQLRSCRRGPRVMRQASSTGSSRQPGHGTEELRRPMPTGSWRGSEPHREPRRGDGGTRGSLTGRPGGRESELGRGRHLRRLVRARPEPLPPHACLAGP